MIRRVIAAAIVAGYLSSAAALLLWPDGEQVRRLLLDVYLYGLNDLGVPATVTPEHYAALANALLFLPVTLGAVVWRGRRRAALILLLGCSAGFAAEYFQASLGLARVAEASDALLNAAGAAVGTGAGLGIDVLLSRRARDGDSTAAE